MLKLFKEVYNDFNITDFWYQLSLPDLKNEDKYENFDLIDDKKIEIMAENILYAKKNNKSIIIAFGAH